MSAAPRELEPRYVEVESPAGSWLARRDCARAVAAGDADFLFETPPGGRVPPGTGRGPIARFSISGRPAIGKRALHGGLMGPLLGGLYLGSRRVFDQARIAARLEARGVPTPSILAAGSRAVLGPIRAHAIVSSELEGARNLYQIGTAPVEGRRRRALLLECADLVRRMHAAGFLHADLNLFNLVLERRGAVEVLNAVDLDRGRFVDALSPRRRLGNLARLLRSHEKWLSAGLPLSGREEIRFLRRYAGPDRALFRYLTRGLVRRRRWFRVSRVHRLLGTPRSESRDAAPFE